MVRLSAKVQNREQLRPSMLTLLLCTSLVSLAIADTAPQPDDDFGKVLNDDYTSLSKIQDGIAPSTNVDSALTDDQLRRKSELESKFNNGDTKLIVKIDSIMPSAGPTSGDTRVLVRGGPFADMGLLFPHPKCKFGRHDMIVDAQYVTCTTKPITVIEMEGKKDIRDDHCLQCESSPVTDEPGVVSLLISLTGDFTDSDDSEPYRYYLPPKINAIYPRYGIKDGHTEVEVWGENFMDFNYNTRCGFGSKTTQARFISSTYMTCLSPESDVVQKPIPFSISLNGQQNTKDDLNFWYYNRPVVSELLPNYGLNQGGNTIMIKGSNFNPFNWEKDIDNRNDTFCYFQQEDLKMPMKVLNSTKAQCEVPPNVMHLDSTFVEVGLNNRDWSDDNVPYFYFAPSRITDIEPNEGPTSGNTPVMVFGIDFTPGKKIICKWGNVKTRGRFISMSQIECLSPPVKMAQKIPISIAYEGDDIKFQSESQDFTYYDTPIITSIEPACGPVTGYTQLTIKGKNFVDMGFNKIKCLFNETAMNATIIDQETLKCSSPRLSEQQQSLDVPYLYSKIHVTLNGRETNLETNRFLYYPELKITQVNGNVGPLSGGTKSRLQGDNFDHPHTCGLKVRYGAIEVQPKLDNVTLETISPKVLIPDAVTLSPSGNGQNYGPDYTLHFRDFENTFTYMQDVFVEDIQPKSGPSSGGTKIVVRGFGLQQFKHDNGTDKLVIPRLRFVDSSNHEVGHQSDALENTATSFTWYTPAATASTRCTLQVSYNDGDYWQSLLEYGQDHSFVYYNAPALYSILPKYGPVKISVNATINGKNFECPDPLCDNLLVRFGTEKDGTIVKGELLSSTQIKVETPAYTKPDVLPLEISFNGVDFTDSNLTYGYFDPFIIKLQPNLISSAKSTKVLLHGFGFIDPDNQNDIKVKFTSPKGELTCNGLSPCVVAAQYINKNTVQCNSLPMSSISFTEGGLPVVIGDPIFAELTLVGNIFTENKIPLFYHRDPEYTTPSRDSVPKNLNQPLIIDTDFHWGVNNVDHFLEHSNFTCLFQVGDEKVVTQGRLETVPFGAQYDTENSQPTHIACSTPKMHNQGRGTLMISPNGQDYTGAIDYEFQTPLDLFRVLPQCGPNDGSTKVKLIGSGFQNQKDQVFSKFGTLSVQEIEKSAVQQMAWDLQGWLDPQLMTQGDLRLFQHKDYPLQQNQLLSSIMVQSPKPRSSGPVYVSVGQHVTTNQIDTNGSNSTEDYYYYTNSQVEFFFYRQPIVKKAEPLSGLTEGGTPIEISGVWFDFKLEYGLVPHCMIGDKIVRAEFHSTVRIVCTTPPNQNTYSVMPIKVSQNGVDWIDSGFQYSYYHQATIKDVFPKSGQMNGGTEVFIIGDHFSNITNPETTKCKWSLIDNAGGQKRDRVIQYTPAQYMNETFMMCVTPSSFIGGDRAFVQLTFNNRDFSLQDENLIFQFYAILSSFPHSGPSNAQNEIILVKGAGFKPSAHVYCSLNKTEMPAIEVTENRIKCPMVWPGKDLRQTGSVKFGISFDGSWTDFGNFFYYQQIELDDIYPRYGPADGHGIITLYGAKFRDDFPNAELGCKIGENIGQGQLIDQNTVRCVVEQIDLVNEGETLPVMVALNSYSWVGEKQNKRLLSESKLGFVPYGIQSIFPESGIMEGFTDIFITGKGFTEDIADRAKCRFGVDGSYQIVDAAVMDYTKLVCRSPSGSDFSKGLGSSILSVPFSISFGEQENKPWTQDLHRFRYYTQPVLGYAVPDEIDVRKKTEIFVVAEDGYRFVQPVPSGRLGMVDYRTGGVSCSFGNFGTSMGMYLNQTTLLCLSPHISGTSDDYSSETVTVAIALNGQDFMEDTSNAQVTFIGTGTDASFFYFVVGALLIALLILALLTCIVSMMKLSTVHEIGPGVVTLRNAETTTAKGYAGSRAMSRSNNAMSMSRR